MYRKDDGSTGAGIWTALVCLACFAIGYCARDSGFKIQVQIPTQQRR